MGMGTEKVERFNEMPSSIKNPKPPSRGSGIFGKPPRVSDYKPMSRQKSRDRMYVNQNNR